MSNTYIKDNLIIEFDTNDIDINDLSLVSKRKWINTKVTSNNLNDYGLNQYDVGLSTDLKNSKILNNTYLTLERIGEPASNNTIDYTNYGLDIENFSSIGKVLVSNGGYLLNPFKYHQYDIEYIPREFDNGFTFETTLFVDENTFKNIDNNSNIFLYLGVRSEDKFASSYSGNTIYTTTENATLDNSYKIYDVSKLKENTQYFTNLTTVLTKENIYIKFNNQIDFIVDYIVSEDFKLIYNGSLLIKDVDYTVDLRLKTISIVDIITNISDELVINYYKLLDDVSLVNINLSQIDNYTSDLEYGLENNVIAFKFDKTGRIGYRKINQSRQIEEEYSEQQAVYDGWNHIVITFKPDKTYTDIKEVDDECKLENPRLGTLSIYVNGLLYYSKANFIEPQFNPYPIDRSKQIGVPYNLSWGGGSVGLKNSYNFNGDTNELPYELNQENENLLIQNNFDGYFKGGFNKLRIYNKYFNTSEVKTNYKFESEYYNIIYNKGGRIIQINDYSPVITFI